MAMQNIKSVLRNATTELKTAGVYNPDLDARVLLEAVLDKKTAYLFAHPEMPMTNAEYGKFRRYIRRRKKGEPVAYILGRKEFFGLDFIVNKNVLIPRPETELLVEEALRYLDNQLSLKRNNCPRARFLKLDSSTPLTTSFRKKDANTTKNLKSKIYILDIGTGSGCIIISLAKVLSNNNIGKLPRSLYFADSDLLYKCFATDISAKALNVAKKNAKRTLFHVDQSGTNYLCDSYQHSDRLERDSNNIKFYRSDLFSNPRLPKKFDLIVANLPYVPARKHLSPRPVLDTGCHLAGDGQLFEPEKAIFAQDNGTAVIKRFLLQAPSRINKGGMILIELDPRNAKTLYQLAQKQFSNAKIELKKDLAKLDRYLKIST